MFEIKEMIENGIESGKDKSKLLHILADSIDCEDSKIETVKKLYTEIYGHHLCDKYCMRMVDHMHNDTEKGKKWTIDQTNEIARKIGISFSNEGYTQYEFWCAMHSEYYLHSNSLSESGITENTIYGKFADDYLDDSNSPVGKLVEHFFFIENNKDK